MVRLVEVVLKPGKRACPPLATPAAGPAAWDARPTPATPGWGCRGNYTTAGDASSIGRGVEQAPWSRTGQGPASLIPVHRLAHYRKVPTVEVPILGADPHHKGPCGPPLNKVTTANDGPQEGGQRPGSCRFGIVFF